MAIEIKTEKVWVKGERHRRITGVKALDLKDLPREYLHHDEVPSCCMTSYGFRIFRPGHGTGCLYVLNPEHHFVTIESPTNFVGETIPEAEFQKFIEMVRRAGDNLMRIKRDSWSGKETVRV